MNKLIIGLLIIVCFMPFVYAIETGDCAKATVTSIEPSSIGIGKEFTVGVQIENCGSKVPDFISFELMNPPTDISIKEPLIINISELKYGSSQQFINYHMKISENAIPGIHIIKARLTYGNSLLYQSKDIEISLNVLGNKAELEIASFKSNPVLPYTKDIVELTMRIENSGKGTAKSVKVLADHDFQGTKQAFIGTLNPNEDGPAVFTFIAENPGEYSFPVIISYRDDYGEKQTNSTININILKKSSNTQAIITYSVIALLFILILIYFIRIKKEKDRIIRQLLRGDGLKKK